MCFDVNGWFHFFPFKNQNGRLGNKTMKLSRWWNQGGGVV